MTAEKETSYFNNVDYRKLCQIYFALTHESSRALQNLIRTNYSINYSIRHDSPAGQHTPDLIGRTALHFAVFWYKDIYVDLLLCYGIDYTIKDANGSTALHLFVERVLDGPKRKGPLKWPIVDLILAAHVRENVITNPISKSGLSHFHIACMSNNVPAVDFFLQNRISVAEAVYSDSSDLPGYTPLHIATRYSCFETVELLLKYGADINAKDARGMSILEKLIHRNKEIMDVLMSINFVKLYSQLNLEFETNIKIILLTLYDVNHNSMKEAILHRFHIACVQGDETRVLDYLKSAIDVNVSINFGYTAMHYAANSELEIVELLMRYGGDIFAKDSEGKTSFDICVRKYKCKVIPLIFSNPALEKLVVFKNEKSRAIMFALRDYYEMKALLNTTKYHSNINTKCVSIESPIWSGCTPLHLAVIFSEETIKPDLDINEICNDFTQKDDEGYWRPFDDLRLDYNDVFASNAMVVLLLNNGADFTIQDSNGDTPLHLAFRTQNSFLITHMLFKHYRNLINPFNNDGLSHFHIACLVGKPKLIKAFLRQGAHEAVNSAIKKDVSFQELVKELRLKHKLMRSGWTPLHIAVARCKIKVVRLLIQYGANVFAKDSDGLTPIHLAINCDSFEIIDLLFLAPGVGKSNPSVADTGLSHFHVACMSTNTRIVEALLKLGFDLNCHVDYRSSKFLTSKNPKFWGTLNGYTPMHFATIFGRTKTLKVLFKHGANVAAKNASGFHSVHCALLRKQINHKVTESFSWLLSTKPIDGMELPQLHIACAMVKIDAVESLLKSGADVNRRINVNSSVWPGYTPLHMVAKFTSNNMTRASTRRKETEQLFDIVKLLLSYGADVTIKNAQNETPLHMAFKLDKNEIVNAIIATDGITKYNVKNSSRLSHFHIACSVNKPDIVEEFLKYGADVNEPQDFFTEKSKSNPVVNCGFSPLHVATKYGHKEVIDVLLQHRANVNAEDRQGRTPLHIACTKSFVEIVEMLLSIRGINVNAVSVIGKTPLQIAVEADFKNIVTMLLKKGARINFRSPVTSTSSYEIALVRANLRIVEILIRQGIDTTYINSQGVSSLHNLFLINPRWSGNGSLQIYLSLIQKLFQRGCDVDSQDSSGRTPFHVAVEIRNVKGVAALLTVGADINVTNQEDKTALELSLESVIANPWFSSRDKVILRDILNYVNKLQIFHVPISKRIQLYYANALWILDNYEASNEYVNELQEMQTIVLSNYSTLYDVLKKDIVEVSVLEQHEKLRAILNSDDTCKKFPHLIGILRLKCKVAKKYRILLEDAQESLTYLMGVNLPRSCSDAIAKYLNFDDLNCINNICKVDYSSKSGDHKRFRLK